MDYAQLLNRYLLNKCSPAEAELLFQWLISPEGRRYLLTTMGSDFEQILKQESDLPALISHRMEQRIIHSIRPERKVTFMRRWGLAAASVLVIIISAVLFQVMSSGRHAANADTSKTTSADIAPGRDGAILTLADGSQVVLDSLGNGLVAAQNGSQAVIRSGELVYHVTGKTVNEVSYNTMSTPKGRQFHLMLPDGTKVWLNSSSSIRYPTIFTGKERKVKIIGEAYFEVAKNTKMPFRVNVNNKAAIDVLGTNFNVNAYENERTVNTTLIEGSVAVTADTAAVYSYQHAAVLKPGQQAQIVNTADGDHAHGGRKTQREIAVLKNINIDKVMAWRNGLFYFDGATLDEIMRQVERWYDIEVVYEQGIPEKKFEGEMTRDIPLNGLLIALKKLGVHYRLEGKRLFVLP